MFMIVWWPEFNADGVAIIRMTLLMLILFYKMYRFLFTGFQNSIQLKDCYSTINNKKTFFKKCCFHQ